MIKRFSNELEILIYFSCNDCGKEGLMPNHYYESIRLFDEIYHAYNVYKVYECPECGNLIRRKNTNINNIK